MESFNGKLRDEVLNRELLLSLPEARYALDASCASSIAVAARTVA